MAAGRHPKRNEGLRRRLRRGEPSPGAGAYRSIAIPGILVKLLASRRGARDRPPAGGLLLRHLSREEKKVRSGPWDGPLASLGTWLVSAMRDRREGILPCAEHTLHTPTHPADGIWRAGATLRCARRCSHARPSSRRDNPKISPTWSTIAVANQATSEKIHESRRTLHPPPGYPPGLGPPAGQAPPEAPIFFRVAAKLPSRKKISRPTPARPARAGRRRAPRPGAGSCRAASRACPARRSRGASDAT